MKKQLSLLLAAGFILTLLLSGCGSNPVAVDKPEWDTVADSSNGFSYEVPADWTITEDVTGQGCVIYVPEDADLTSGSSNVNILVQSTGQKAASAKEMKAAFESDLEGQLLANGFEKVENLKIDELEAPIGTVSVVSYDIYLGGMKFSQTQFYPLIDDYVVVVTATDIGISTTPSVDEVAEYVTLTLKKEG